MLHMLGDGRVAEVGKVVRAPVPLQASYEQPIEYALHHRKGCWRDMIEEWRTDRAHAFGSGLGFFRRSGAAPHDGTNFLHMQMLGKHRRRWDHQVCKEPVHILRGLANEI